MSPIKSNGRYDAIVVGSGPNGLAAAIVAARAGLSVLVREARETYGGGARSAELTLAGFTHDLCSAVHPLGLSSPLFRSLPLPAYGLRWIHPQAPLAHPLDDGSAIVLFRSIEATAHGLGADGAAYRRLFAPLAGNWEKLQSMILGPMGFPRNPMLMARFGLAALLPARTLARRWFRHERGRALFAGLAAHSALPLERPVSAAFGLVLGATGHAVGWPLAAGGSQQITEALVQHLRSLGADIVTDAAVAAVDDLPPSRATLLDVTPRQLLELAGNRFPTNYRRKLERFRYGPGAYKVDWALDAPIPWKAPECAQAATVHLGGSADEIAASERAPWNGENAERPFVLLVQPTLFDPARAPCGKHVAWGYCHVPNGSTVDMTSRIENQIERFAPGFRNRILARHVMPPAKLQAHNPNLIGGDINGGVQDMWQLFTRPTLSLYSTPAAGIYLCSSSTPPGGGVHGMCGYFAAKAALEDFWPNKIVRL
ncbi:MAG TPA: NAD(P)/FAD-dependent oxidoreductase [Candidatus Binataceae bacterium]